MSKKLEITKDRIKGALYGFAIGDAMGATTEFMTSGQVRNRYEQVTDIIGGGWLNLEPGQVTDDTQMSICVMDAIMDSHKLTSQFYSNVGNNFVKWYKSNPPDVGGQCSKGIVAWMEHKQVVDSTDGNGSLMRALPCALIRRKEWNQIQGAITHPTQLCHDAIDMYHEVVVTLVYCDVFRFMPHVEDKVNPTGYVVDTLTNALYWAKAYQFEDVILGAVNDGGDADTIAAIAGSIGGANLGYSSIPERWIKQLDTEVKNKLDKFADYCLKTVAI